MAGKNKSGGGAKKHGRDTAKCQRYKSRMIRYINKLKRFLKHNVSREATEQEIDTKRKEFKQIQENRQKK